MLRAALAAAVLSALLLAAPASAATRFVRVAGVPSPGTPAKYDRVGILKIGKPTARNVLVLNPGTSASAAYFQPLARAIVARSPKWQVWSVERRENLLEDQSMLDRAKAGKATIRQVFDYYLGWLAGASVTEHVRLIGDAEVGFARAWGMATEVGDLRKVVRRAARLGGKVVLGGHSLGGTITTAYATWDFAGKPGAADLDGLVFIDGGSRTEPIGADDARAALADLRTSSPWLTFGGIAAPFTGLFNSTGSLAVKLAPDQVSDGQGSGLLPPALVPPMPVTNAGLYGFALDTETSPPELAAAQAHLGRLAAAGDPRGWNDAGELTPLTRFATLFSGWGLEHLDGTAWYHPRRLTLDAGAVGNGRANPAQEVMGVRATHGADLPRRLRMYAFGAALGGTRVLDATRALALASKIPRRQLVLVDRHATYAHNDPNSASPRRNAFLAHLIPFLRAVRRG